MNQEMDFFDKLYAAYVRAFVEHDPSWLTASAWVAGLVVTVIAVLAHHRAERWHEHRLANARPALTQEQMTRSRRWFFFGNWAALLLILVLFVLVHNWP